MDTFDDFYYNMDMDQEIDVPDFGNTTITSDTNTTDTGLELFDDDYDSMVDDFLLSWPEGR